MKTRGILPVLFLLGVIAISGCVATDPAALAQMNPMVQQFLEDHPNAEVRVTHYTKAEAETILDEIMENCQKRNMTAKEFYKITIEDQTDGFSIIAWVDWENKIIECAMKKGGDAPNATIECKSHYKLKCYGENLYWFNSCGVKEMIKEKCPGSCSKDHCIGEKTCEDKGGRCIYLNKTETAITSTAEISVFQESSITGNIYATTSGASSSQTADVIMPTPIGSGSSVPTESSSSGGGFCSQYYTCPDGGMVQYCELEKDVSPVTCVETEAGKACSSGSISIKCVCRLNPEKMCAEGYGICGRGYAKADYWCPDNGICCMPGQEQCQSHYKLACHDGHVYWMDSCGKAEEKKQYCENGCSNGACIREMEFCGRSTYASCSSESNISQCIETGCSGEVCAGINEGIASACIWTECFDNKKFGMECGCYDGKCQWQKTSFGTCTDSDGGKDYYEKGRVIDKYGEVAEDICKDHDYLMEKSCGNEGGFGIDVYECPYGCESGACKTISVKCTDSDGGLAYEEKGVASGITDAGNEFSKSDSCVDEFNLGEYYCSDTSPVYSNYSCIYGCREGACLKEIDCNQVVCTGLDLYSDCRDFDEEGLNYYEAGDNMIFGEDGFAKGNILKEYCIDETTLQEYYCNHPVSPYECPYGCEEGACVEASTTCQSDIECGTNSTSYFCHESNSTSFVYANVTMPRCMEPGTNESYCSSANAVTQHDVCQNGCENGACTQ